MKEVRMKEDLSPFLPLSPAMLHILLALAAGDRHGYGIMQEVARESGGQYKLGPGTLYDNLQKMMNQALVEEAAAKSADDDPRRRYYRLTGLGRRVLSAEVDRLEKTFATARAHLRGVRGKKVTS
jgi:DNA-binding PadR family transcriptional regulator